ncbi:DNA-3-methyladenine glycosylase 1 [Zancudomyces culisetae]|uniref:DNA-3-methyladenine glycosylase 1 n=1 Tax=Zancudomyces culisetae TaxID=1213189 RepID=A0A1R1PF72_ZANCU|nr:DNA-3-methyladenine glycosylase 1 [Zancudomyces culisetae]|eukprot:OMH79650.1 DNA-3-methyladenine glycosylase 1 [Zancudomyces culisetae]
MVTTRSSRKADTKDKVVLPTHGQNTKRKMASTNAECSTQAKNDDCVDVGVGVIEKKDTKRARKPRGGNSSVESKPRKSAAKNKTKEENVKKESHEIKPSTKLQKEIFLKNITNQELKDGIAHLIEVDMKLADFMIHLNKTPIEIFVQKDTFDVKEGKKEDKKELTDPISEKENGEVEVEVEVEADNLYYIEHDPERGSSPGAKSAFQVLVRSIIGQQISNIACKNIYNRFINMFDELKAEPDIRKTFAETNPPTPGTQLVRFPKPSELMNVEEESLRSVGLSLRKAGYLKSLSKFFYEKKMTDEKLHRLNEQEISKLLIQIDGIGQWTIDMLLIFHLKYYDVLPKADLVVRKGIAHHFNVPFKQIEKINKTNDAAIDQMTTLWKPYRSIATWYMYQLKHFLKP